MKNWRRAGGFAGMAFLALLANSFYLLAFAPATIFHLANVLAHPVLGIAVAAGFALLLARSAGYRARVKWAAAVLFAGAALGAALAWTGASSGFRWLLWAHIAVSFAGVLMLIRASRWPAVKWTFSAGVVFVALVAGIGAARPDPSSRIRNPADAPASMVEGGAGPQTPFWPSPARTSGGGTLPSSFFMESKLCGECHKDIYRQWESSMHHYSSLNNQFYRRAAEHMQELMGAGSSKWCAGCHDHALLFSGMWERPIREQLDRPEAHAGLGCVSCHSIVHVDGSMGNGGFTLAYPGLYGLASSPNPQLRQLYRLAAHLDPEPHRRTYMKPFMREDAAEFCSACHKVHLDLPVNNYRWLRGFNDYDNWQASGVSGQGARSFYYPEKPETCTDCHMPLVPSRDPGSRNGFVRSHRFAAANTAVPYVNGDTAQLKAVEEFLKSGFITADIFAASPAEDEGGEVRMLRPEGDPPQAAMTSFAAGEETDAAGPVFLREVGKVAAPLDQPGVVFRPGGTVRLDVVVRTRKIGHFFPAGTVDAFDVWLEVKGEDATGRTAFWSGRIADEGRGPVDAGAHFYRSLMLDGAGNPIDKRNTWQTRGLLYVRLIPPGAADVARYRVKIPHDAKGPITMTAKLHYRKFSWQYTRFAYAGRAPDGQDPRLVSPHYDSRQYSYSPSNIPSNAAGKVKDRIPALPVVTLAQARAVLNVGLRGAETEWKPVARKVDRERWNDWGIGLLLQGDLRGAEYAFRKVAEADPEYADGWINIARALIREGRSAEARPLLERALRLNPRSGPAHFYLGMAQKADGEYAQAAGSLRKVIEQYPRDRVVQNQLGRLLLLQGGYAGAVRAFRAVLAVDPEDVQAHHGLAQAYRGLGDVEKTRRHEILFRRFKADEFAQTNTGQRRRESPEDENERRAIHEHESIPLP